MENEEKLIGSRIKSLRKENKMSQEELASKLGISRSYFSKIENGQRGLSIEIMQKLCKVFNMSMDKFLETIEEKDNYLKVETKKFRKKVFKFRIINFAAIALTILFVLLSMYFFNNFNRIRDYVLNGDSDTFTYTTGIFAESSQKFILKSGTFDIKNDKVKENDIINVEFKIDDELIKGQSSFFTGINIEDYSYDELFTKKGYKNSKFTVDITYKLNGEEKKETMIINKDLAISNNKLIYPKGKTKEK
mgnify:FL=1